MEKAFRDFKRELEKRAIGLEKLVNDRIVELREKNDYLQSIWNKSLNGIITVDNYGKIQDINPAAETIFGYSLHEIINASVEELIPDTLVGSKQKGTAYLAGGNKKMTAKRKDGVTFPIEIGVSDIRMGGDIWYVGIIRDVSDELETEALLKEKEEQFRIVTSSLPNVVFMTDLTKGCCFLNKAWINYTGRKLEEDLGFGWKDNVHPEDREAAVKTYLSAFDEKKKFTYEMRLRHYSGEYRTFFVDGVPRYDNEGEFTGFVGSCTDITERKELELELKAHRDNLQDLVDSKTADLVVALEQAEIAQEMAERANQAKSEFLSNMSHEIRTPMHAILSFSSRGVDKAKDPELKELFSDIKTSGQRLIKLLNDLLDLSKLEAEKMVLCYSDCNIGEVVQHAVRELEGLAKEKALGVKVIQEEVPDIIHIDRDKIIQVLINLLSNAIKFSRRGEDIVIHIGQVEEGDDKPVCIKIIDKGVGIPTEELVSIFDKFVQSSKTKTGAGGTGLGLAICEEIIQLHHGKIWAESEDRGGATFVFTLPLEMGGQHG